MFRCSRQNYLPTTGIVGILIAMSSSPVNAQGIEEIVVTAQKREQSLQDVPASITAFSGDTLDRNGVRQVADFFRSVPGLHFGNHSDMKTSETSIRGIRSESRSAGQDPAVGYYLDEIFLGPGVSAGIDYYDIERIEVIRGPQGTLFGRNTIGGVVNITTRRPTDEFEGYIEVGAGNYSLIETKGAISGPLNDAVQGRLAFSYLDRDGFGENLVTGNDVEDANRQSIRGSLTAQPTENLEVFLSADYLRVDQNTNALETLAYSENPGNFLATFLGGFPGPNQDPYDRDTYGDIDPVEDLEMSGGTLHVTWSLPFGDLVSVSGYREHEYFSIYASEQTSARWTYSSFPEEVQRFSQEVRLVSTDEGNLDWILGAYYYSQETESEFFGLFGEDLLGFLGLPPGFFVFSTGQQEADSVAVFGNVTSRFADRWIFNLGARYTYDDKKIAYIQNDAIGVIGGSREFSSSKDFSEWTPTVSLTYELTDTKNLYATVSKGFKGGGFNDFIGDATAAGFEPETLWNYEAGFKGAFDDRKLVVNLSVFYMEWDDIQLQADNPNTPFFDPATRNAGSAHSQGLELEGLWQPIETLSFNAGLSLLEAEFDEGFLPNGTTPLRKIPRAPEYTANLEAKYRFNMTSRLKAEMSLQTNFVGPHYLDITNISESKVDSYEIVNAQVSISDSSEKWSVSLWAQNLNDNTHLTRFFDVLGNPLVGQHLVVLN